MNIYFTHLPKVGGAYEEFVKEISQKSGRNQLEIGQKSGRNQLEIGQKSGRNQLEISQKSGRNTATKLLSQHNTAILNTRNNNNEKKAFATVNSLPAKECINNSIGSLQYFPWHYYELFQKLGILCQWIR